MIVNQIDNKIMNHINNSSVHVTAEEKSALSGVGEYADKIVGMYQYGWKRRSISTSVIKESISSNYIIWCGWLSWDIKYSKTLNIDPYTGEFSLNNPISISNWSTDGTVVDTAITELLNNAPCYIYGIRPNDGFPESISTDIFYITENYTFLDSTSTVIKSYNSFYENNVYSTKSTSVPPLEVVKSTPVTFGDWEEIYSENRNAYPDSGISDGYEYQFIGRPYDNLLAPVRIATGSYTGTGTYGSSNPNSLTFDFPPKVVWIYIMKRDSAFETFHYSDAIIVPMDGLTGNWANSTPPFKNGQGTYSYSKKSSDGKTLYYYNQSDPSYQFNYSGTTYYYIAIG